MNTSLTSASGSASGGLAIVQEQFGVSLDASPLSTGRNIMRQFDERIEKLEKDNRELTVRARYSSQDDNHAGAQVRKDLVLQDSDEHKVYPYHPPTPPEANIRVFSKELKPVKKQKGSKEDRFINMPMSKILQNRVSPTSLP
jgi:hypothetical protein